MRTSTFKGQWFTREVTFITEHYSSVEEIIRVSQGRPVPHLCLKDSDYLGDEKRTYSPDFYGFDEQSELMDMVAHGIIDPEFTTNIRKVKSNVQVKDRDRLVKTRRDVCGGAVNVPSFIQGVPECMTRMVKTSSKSKIIRLGVIVGYNCKTDMKALDTAIYSLALTIASLEKSGFRVEVTLIISAVPHPEYGKHIVISCLVPLKRANEPLNLAKLRFMLASPAFFRGVGFGWIARNPNMTPDRGLGQPLAQALYGQSGTELIDAFLHAELPDATVVDVATLLRKAAEVNRDASDKFRSRAKAELLKKSAYTYQTMGRYVESLLVG